MFPFNKIKVFGFLAVCLSRFTVLSTLLIETQVTCVYTETTVFEVILKLSLHDYNGIRQKIMKSRIRTTLSRYMYTFISPRSQVWVF